MRMLIFVKMKLAGEWQTIRCLLDSGAEENFASRSFCKQFDLELQRDKDGPTAMKTLNDKREVIHGHTVVESRFTDTMGALKQTSLKLYAVDMFDYDVVVGYPWLYNSNPIIN
jgi:hypothetical protein